MRKYFALAVLAVGCGDNVEVCEVVPQVPAPMGPLSAVELPLPADCVPGGLDELPGRWFVRDPDQQFKFRYPLIEQRCDGTFGTLGHVDDREFGEDRRIVHQWSDGDKLYEYRQLRFELPDFVYERATLDVLCRRADGTIGGAWAFFDTDFGMATGALVGSPFGPREDDEARGLELVGELGTSTTGKPIKAYNLVVDGTLAYVVGPEGFDIVDVANPAAPRALAHLDEYANDVRVVTVGDKRFAYLAMFEGDVTRSVEVTDPAAPVVAGSMQAYSHSLQVADGKLYLANYTGSIPVFDYVTNPALPLLVAEIPVDDRGAIHDLTVDGTRVFANDTVNGFIALDATAMAAPVELQRAPGSYSHASWVASTGSTRLVLHGDEGMTGTPDGGAYLTVLGGDPAVSSFFMKELGRYQSRPEVGIHNFEMHGDRVYIAYYQDGVRVVDVSTPAKPTEVAHFNTLDYETALGASFEGALGIRVVNGLIYVADSNRGLIILREI